MEALATSKLNEAMNGNVNGNGNGDDVEMNGNVNGDDEKHEHDDEEEAGDDAGESSGDQAWISCLAASDDGQWLVSSDTNGRVTIYNLDTLQVSPFSHHDLYSCLGLLGES